MRLSIRDGIGIVSAVLILVGGFLPWWSVTLMGSTAFFSGFQELGVTTVILSLISLAVTVVSKSLLLKRMAAALTGVPITFIALFYYAGLTSMMVESSRPNPEIGLVMTLAGGIGLVASFFLMRTKTEVE